MTKEENNNKSHPKSEEGPSWKEALIWCVGGIFLLSLFQAPAQSQIAHSKITGARLWLFKADMDGNGVVSISDTLLWVKWLFFYPGDLLILMIAQSTYLQTFFELSANTFGNWFSMIISFCFWFPIFLIVFVILVLRFD